MNKGLLLITALMLLSLSVFAYPIIGIHSPSNNSVFNEGESIHFVAYVADQFYDEFAGTCGYPSNPNTNCFSWYDNGLLMGKGTVLNKVLENGTHNIYFSAVNPDGEVTTDLRTIYVGINPNENNSPELSSLPNVYIRENAGYSSNLIDLWNYAFDEEDSDSELSFRITNQSNSGLIYCRIQSNRWFECDAPSSNRTGTNYVTIEVKDTGNLTDSETVRVEVYGSSPYNEAPEINLPSYWEIDSDEDYEKLDLYPYISDDEDSDYELDLSIDDESNTDVVNCHISEDRYLYCYPYEQGYSYVKIRVEDSDGLSDTDSIKIMVDEDYGTNDLELNLPTSWEMNEDDSTRTLDLMDYTSYSGNDNEITYTITKETNTGDVDCYISGDYLKCNPKNEGYSYVTVKAYADGETDYDTIKVIVEAEGSSSSDCADIYIKTYSVTVKEGNTEYAEFELQNNSSKTFYVSEIKAYDNLSWITSSTYSTPKSVSGNKDISFKVKLKANSVTATKTGTAYIKLTGHYSGKSTCTKTVNYSVKVTNTGTEYEEEEEEFGEETFDPSIAEVKLEKKAITLNKGESETIDLFVKNNSNTSECFDLSTSTTSVKIKAELTDESFCLSKGQKENLALRVLADTDTEAGWYSVTLTTEFDNKLDKQSISVYVRGTSTDKPIEEIPEIKLIQFPSEVTFGEETEKELNFTIENSGETTANNVLIALTDLPDGISFEPVIVSFIAGNNARTVNGTLMVSNEAIAGEVTALIEVIHGNQTITKEMKIIVAEKAPNLGLIDGLINAASESGLGLILGLIVLLALSVIVIYYAVSKP
ncbi:MAG: hypothetical protein JW703_03740 [Candidatus Diapherotrites archaeon]|nr:hypothetical protein [Candidatus Diapherotrites archaeon]